MNVLGTLRQAVAGPSIWLIVGGVAAIYIAIVVVGLAEGQATRGVDVAEQPPDDMGTKSPVEPSWRLTDRVKQQNALIKELRGRIDGLENTIGHLRSRNDDLTGRLSSLEDSLGPNTAALPDTEASNQRMARADDDWTPQANREPEKRYVPPLVVAYTPLPSDGFGDESEPEPPAGLQVAPAARASPERVSKRPTQTLFAVKLAIGPDAAALAPSWKLVKRNHGDLVASLTARIVERTSGRTSRHELIAGPIENAATAARICAKLRASSLYCQETMFAAGRSLAQ